MKVKVPFLDQEGRNILAYQGRIKIFKFYFFNTNP